MDNKFEIVRSFSFKKNLGNFENFDVFCSIKEGFDKLPERPVINKLSKAMLKTCYELVNEDVEKAIGWIERDKLSITSIKNAGIRAKEKVEERDQEFVADEDPSNEDLAG